MFGVEFVLFFIVLGPGGGMRMYRKASKQRNWPREPLTRIIVNRTKLHIKQQRRKQKGT